MDYKRLNTLDKRTPNRGANPFVDDYTGFTWNGVHSSNFNCFIENTGHLEFVGAPEFSNNFISPAFQTRTYYTGTASQSKKFQLNLVFYQLTLAELNAALHWLDRSIISDLYFDYEPYWKYSCKLASMGAIEKYPNGRTIYRGRPCDIYLCRVVITFETVYHPEAISAYTVFKTSEQTSNPIPTGSYYKGMHVETINTATELTAANTIYLINASGTVYQDEGMPPYYTPGVHEGTPVAPGDMVQYTSDHFVITPNTHYSDLEYSLDAGASYMPFHELKPGVTEKTLNDNIKLDTTGNGERYVDADKHSLTVADIADYWENMIIIRPADAAKSGEHYWQVRLYNPSSHSTTFKLHFYNITDTVDVWRVWNRDYMLHEQNTSILDEEEDIDAYNNSLNIVHIDMVLDDDHKVNLHYNSEDGTVLLGNQLVESVRGLSMPLCKYKSASANVLIPGAIDSDHPAYVDLEIQLSGANSQFAVEYDTYEYTV